MLVVSLFCRGSSDKIDKMQNHQSTRTLLFPALKEMELFPGIKECDRYCEANTVGIDSTCGIYNVFLRIERLKDVKDAFLGVQCAENEKNAISFGQQFSLDESRFYFLCVYVAETPCGDSGPLSILVLPANAYPLQSPCKKFHEIVQEMSLDKLNLSATGPSYQNVTAAFDRQEAADLYAHLLSFFLQPDAEARARGAAKARQAAVAQKKVGKYIGWYEDTIAAEALIKAEAGKKRKLARDAQMKAGKKMNALLAAKEIKSEVVQAPNSGKIDSSMMMSFAELKQEQAQQRQQLARMHDKQIVLEKRQEEHSNLINELVRSNLQSQELQRQNQVLITSLTGNVDKVVSAMGDTTSKFDTKVSALTEEIRSNASLTVSEFKHVVDHTNAIETRLQSAVLDYIHNGEPAQQIEFAGAQRPVGRPKTSRGAFQHQRLMGGPFSFNPYM
jgi:hypothetical protein